MLGWPWKGFSSRPYREVPVPRIEGLGNLTGDLTEPLTPDLTGYLTADLTKSGGSEGQTGGQRGSGDGLEAVTAFPLGGIQNFGHHAVMDVDSLGDHVLSGF